MAVSTPILQITSGSIWNESEAWRIRAVRVGREPIDRNIRGVLGAKGA